MLTDSKAPPQQCERGFFRLGVYRMGSWTGSRIAMAPMFPASKSGLTLPVKIPVL